LNFLRRLWLAEWILLAYFLYVAVLVILFPLQPDTIVRAWLVLAGAATIFVILTQPAFGYARDWIPLVLVLLAYREMDWFSVGYKARHLEQQWLAWDHRFLFDCGFREWVEALGPVIPSALELAYFLVYGVGAFSVAAFYFSHRRERIHRFLTVYLLGTLLAYALFPYFPSDPPRVLFPGADLPHYLTALRRLNLMLVGGYGIHSSVFPSAHVSSAFSAAWGLMRFLPEYRWVGWTALGYAIVVSIATVYGRYHYAVDGVAGFVISVIALAVVVQLQPVSTSIPRP
jgi:membrane-associated phospholipid phosphatase